MTSNDPADHPEAVAAALQLMDDYLVAFNARDYEAIDGFINYPSVRLAETELILLEPGHYTADLMSSGSLAEWNSSEWNSRVPVQASDEKVHVAVEFTRYRPDGSAIGTFHTMYILTRQDGHWGIKMRSSFIA